MDPLLHKIIIILSSFAISFFSATATNNKVNYIKPVNVELRPVSTTTETLKIDLPKANTTQKNQSSGTAPTTKNPEPPKKTASAAKKTSNKAPESLDVKVTQDSEMENKISEQKTNSLSASEVNNIVRKALVNIICTVNTSDNGETKAISGSGITIDKRGIILTNAHIAEYLLLKDYPKKDSGKCVVRTGSPATPKYIADLLFLPKSWLDENAKSIKETDPMGTGENDYALIYIKNTTDNSPLPSEFPYLEPNFEEISPSNPQKEDYLVAGYPAGFLGGLQIYKDLYASTSIIKTQNVYTFKENTVDILDFGGNILAQKGSSGGPIVRISNQKIDGIIVTTTEAATTAERNFRAISLPYINRSLKSEIGESLSEYLKYDLNSDINNFNSLLKGYLVEVAQKTITH